MPPIVALLSIGILKAMPYSTLFVALVALALNLVANVVTRATMDIDVYRRVYREYSEYQKQLRDAVRSGDMEMVERLRKRFKPVQDQMLKLQMDRLRISLYYLIPFMILYYMLAYFMGPTIVAVSPYKFNLYIISAVEPVAGGYGMTLVTWYIFTSVALSVVITRLFGLQV